METNWSKQSHLTNLNNNSSDEISKIQGILIDTSFLISIVELGKDIFSMINEHIGENLPFVILKSVENELHTLISKGDSIGLKAKSALNLITNFNIIDYDENNNVDDSLIKITKKINFIVATTDNDLRKKLRDNHVPVIYIKNGYIKTDNYIMY